MLTILLAGVLAVQGADASGCGSGELARSRRAEMRERVKPGMSFEEVCRQIGPPDVAPEYWGEPPRKDMGPWLLTGRDGRRVAVEILVCDFDDRDRLVGCRDWREPEEIQEIELTSYSQVEEGQPTEMVIEALCQPGTRRPRSRGGEVFEYRVHRPNAQHNQWCPAYFSFADGHLVEKWMVCR